MPEPFVRDGFRFQHERFTTKVADVERVPPGDLRNMFLPRLTPAANKKLRDHYEFVRCQLKHYGVEYDENDFKGNGTNLLKKMLLAGKMDKVPDHIENLRLQMAEEWFDKLTLEEMVGSYPDQIFKKYFLDASGRPDRAKTTGPLAIPIPPSSNYRKGRVLEAAGKVSGLRCQSAEDTLYVGWDRAAVESAAAGHAGKMARKRKQEEDARNQERRSMHSDYLREAQRAKGKGAWSPVGRYIIDCGTIEREWPDQAQDLTLDLYETGEPGVFEAQFDFGVIEGIMILSHQKAVLDQYCAQLDREEDPYGDDDDDDDDDGEDESAENQSDDDEDQPATGSKRKAKVTRGRGRPPKKAKGSPAQPLKFFFKWRGMETGEGQIIYQAQEGFIKFDNSKFGSFTGKADIAFVGRGVSFTARKVSGAPLKDYTSWSSYSEASYERSQASRWH